jgi:hypothetical protein
LEYCDLVISFLICYVQEDGFYLDSCEFPCQNRVFLDVVDEDSEVQDASESEGEESDEEKDDISGDDSDEESDEEMEDSDDEDDEEDSDDENDDSESSESEEDIQARKKKGKLDLQKDFILLVKNSEV